VIRKRILEYNNKTAPVADFYKKQNKFKSINGIGSINEIFDAITGVITAY
jgi:adenylate kinase